MDTETIIQKRKRADTIQNKYKSDASEESTIICDTSHFHGKPSNMEDDSDDSDVDQPDMEPLTASTLFKSIQFVPSHQEDDMLGVAKPSEDQMRFTLAHSRKIFII